MPIIDSILPIQIRQIRGSLSQRAFAKKLGVSQSTVHRWETAQREPSASHLYRLMKLGQSSVDLLAHDKSEISSEAA